MREIKFRGKRIDNGEWVYGWLIKDESGEVNIVNNYGTSYSWDGVDPETVSQYTGLKDRNEKEIYEGDILHWDKIMKVYSRITFSDGAFWSGGAPLYDCLDEEVVGNIFDNPNLLEG